MPRSMHVAAVIFDMDGLMLDTEAMVKPCFYTAAAELQCDLDDEFYGTLIGRGTADSDAALLARFGARFPLDELKRRTRSLLRAQMMATGIPIKPGLHELLAVLERHDVPTAVATSTDAEDAEFSLRTAGLWERFSIVVTGDQVPRGKPEPDIYLEAASRLRVEAVTCVAVEDSSAGVLAATRAGMTTLMVPDGLAPSSDAQAAAFAILPSLAEATELIVGWVRSDSSR